MDEVEASMCVDRIQGMYERAMYYKAGKVTEKDSGKSFIPDWAKLQDESSIQATLAQDMVCLHISLQTCLMTLVLLNQQCIEDKTEFSWILIVQTMANMFLLCI